MLKKYAKEVKDEITFTAVDVDTDGNYVFKDITQDAPKGLAGEGMPVTGKAARAMISNYWSAIANNLRNAQASGDNKALDQILNINIAATFGKETLLFILSQERCEGLRFYFAIKPTKIEDEDIDGGGGITLVVTGVEIVGDKVVDFGTRDTIMGPLAIDGNDNGRHSEVVPPTRVKDVLEHLKNVGDRSMLDNFEKNVSDFLQLDSLL